MLVPHKLLVLSQHPGARMGTPDNSVQRPCTRALVVAGVGIQNMSKEYLPRDALGAKTDRVLRLQARRDYSDLDVAHPMRDWERTAGTGGAAGATVEEEVRRACVVSMLRVCVCVL